MGQYRWFIFCCQGPPRLKYYFPLSYIFDIGCWWKHLTWESISQEVFPSNKRRDYKRQIRFIIWNTSSEQKKMVKKRTKKKSLPFRRKIIRFFFFRGGFYWKKIVEKKNRVLRKFLGFRGSSFVSNHSIDPQWSKNRVRRQNIFDKLTFFIPCVFQNWFTLWEICELLKRTLGLNVLRLPAT